MHEWEPQINVCYTLRNMIYLFIMLLFSFQMTSSSWLYLQKLTPRFLLGIQIIQVWTFQWKEAKYTFTFEQGNDNKCQMQLEPLQPVASKIWKMLVGWNNIF